MQCRILQADCQTPGTTFAIADDLLPVPAQVALSVTSFWRLVLVQLQQPVVSQPLQQCSSLPVPASVIREHDIIHTASVRPLYTFRPKLPVQSSLSKGNNLHTTTHLGIHEKQSNLKPYDSFVTRTNFNERTYRRDILQSLRLEINQTTKYKPTLEHKHT